MESRASRRAAATNISRATTNISRAPAPGPDPAAGGEEDAMWRQWGEEGEEGGGDAGEGEGEEGGLGFEFVDSMALREKREKLHKARAALQVCMCLLLSCFPVLVGLAPSGLLLYLSCPGLFCPSIATSVVPCVHQYPSPYPVTDCVALDCIVLHRTVRTAKYRAYCTVLPPQEAEREVRGGVRELERARKEVRAAIVRAAEITVSRVQQSTFDVLMFLVFWSLCHLTVIGLGKSFSKWGVGTKSPADSVV